MSEPRYRRSPEALHSNIGEDVVALHVRRGNCYGMEKVTANVWHMLEEELDIDQICERLTHIYEVDDETCRADVTKLIDKMKDEGLIEEAANPH